MQSRISWSSAPRLSGFEILILATRGPGSSRRTFPLASASAKDYQRVAFGDGLAFLALDLLHSAVVLGLDRHLHLHRLEDHESVALLDLIADLALDLPHGPGDVGLDVWQLRPPARRIGVSGTIPGREPGNHRRGERLQRGGQARR